MVVQPILRFGQLVVEGASVGLQSECVELAAFFDAVAHAENVRLQIILPCVDLRDLPGLRDHLLFVLLSGLQFSRRHSSTTYGGNCELRVLVSPFSSALGSRGCSSLQALRVVSPTRNWACWRHRARGRRGRSHFLRWRVLASLLFDELRLGHLECPVQRQVRTHLDLALLGLGWQLHSVHAEVLRDSWWKPVVGITSPELEGLLAEEGHDLREIHERALREDDRRPLLRSLRVASSIGRRRWGHLPTKGHWDRYGI